MTQRIFVYGTLMPGQPRWPTLAPFADSVVAAYPARVRGNLYDTHYGWPAAVFGKVTSEVPGIMVTLRHGRAKEALATLDVIEGVSSGLFARQRVLTHHDIECWAYHWPLSTAQFAKIESWDPVGHMN